MNKFSVTYEIITEESAEQGDAEERGFLLANVSFREAFSEVIRHGYIEASCAPICGDPHCWFTAYGEMDMHTGNYENLSLHCPKTITPASHRRIARLLGIKR